MATNEWRPTSIKKWSFFSASDCLSIWNAINCHTGSRQIAIDAISTCLEAVPPHQFWLRDALSPFGLFGALIFVEVKTPVSAGCKE